MKQQKKRWYIKFPRDAYAIGPTEPMLEKDVRPWARKFEGVERLPRGFEYWEAT